MTDQPVAVELLERTVKDASQDIEDMSHENTLLQHTHLAKGIMFGGADLSFLCS